MSLAWTMWMVELMLSLLWFYLFGSFKGVEEEKF
jgi:hypothetical protein